MEVGPFRTIPAAQTQSGQVELKFVEGGWEEFATIVFGEFGVHMLESSSAVLNALLRSLFTVDQPPGTGFSTVPTNHYLHELSQVSPGRALRGGILTPISVPPGIGALCPFPAKLLLYLP